MAINNASNPQNSGSFIPTTNIWDVSEVYSIENVDPQLRELLVRLYQNLNLMALTLNTKESGFYVLNQFVDGNVWFSNPTLNSNSSTTPALRQEYRIVINFGALPNAATKSVAHGITVTSATTFTNIWGVASKTNSYLPLPYSSSIDIAHNIELNVDNTNVNVITGTNYSSYTTTYIILEYLQN